MPEVSVVVELRVTVEDDLDPLEFEHALAAEGARATRELARSAFEVIDRREIERCAGARQRLEPRWVATIFGRVRVWRYRVKAPEGSHHPLDRAMGWSQAEPSAAAGGGVRRGPAGPVPPGR